MKHLIYVMLFSASILPAQVQYPPAPNWTSQDNDYSTGGAFADVNGDGLVDFCTSNGNDMDTNRNAVYYNLGDSLERAASWRSADRGYFGHCYPGDVDNDGDIDLAVAFLGPTGDLRARVYRNTGAGLETSPSWRAQDQHSSFDCCLGDVDLDGDLDLAISAGDAYSSGVDPARIYRNSGGTFDSLPFWTAGYDSASDAIRFCDIDDDGDLDLFTGHRRRLLMYRNNSGVLDNAASWVARTGVGWVLRLEPGDFSGDSRLDLAVACNDQLGDPNGVRVYRNIGGQLDTLPAYSMWLADDFTSCVAWADIEFDGDYDLAAGGWWQPIAVFLNDNGFMGTTPAWSWSPSNPQNLVCEAIAFGDLRNRSLLSCTEAHSGDGLRRLFSSRRRPWQFLDSVSVEDSVVPVAGYCWDAASGWVSFVTPPPAGTGNVTFHYRAPTHPDLAVTNWVRGAGNHLFLNDLTGLAAAPRPAPVPVAVLPNPSAGEVRLQFPSAVDEPIGIYARDGRLVRRLASPRGRWDGRDEAGRPVGPGVYVARCAGASARVVRVAPR